MEIIGSLALRCQDIVVVPEAIIKRHDDILWLGSRGHGCGLDALADTAWPRRVKTRCLYVSRRGVERLVVVYALLRNILIAKNRCFGAGILSVLAVRARIDCFHACGTPRLNLRRTPCHPVERLQRRTVGGKG